MSRDETVATLKSPNDRTITAPPADREALPTQGFADFGLDPRVLAALAREGITRPFPIQEQALRDGLAGRDLCAKAPTGSGKTLAFGLVAVERTPKCPARQPYALILVPTRELARQVAAVLMPLAKERRRWVTALYGGASMGAQIEALRRGADIVVATPGRLLDLLERRALTLDGVGLAVVDEADRMADMGFMPDVREILDQTGRKRQTMLYSATLDGAVDELVKHYLSDPAEFSVDTPALDEGGAAGTVTHYRIEVGSQRTCDVVATLARAASRTIVFAGSRLGAERLADELEGVGLRTAVLHGGMTQAARQRSVAQIASGRCSTLVATDVAARGLHVDGVDLVIHADPVFEDKDYVHRSGRTGRAGADGTVVHLVRAKSHAKIAKMYRRLGVDVVKATAASLVAQLG